MALASITKVTSRFNRMVFTTTEYQAALSSPPLRRSFNSDQEIQDIILEADELLMLDVRNTVGHPWASQFFTLSAALVNGDKIPACDAPVVKVTWATTSNGTYSDSEECDRADIIEAVRDYTLFGAAASDTYGYHNIVADILYTTSPFVKVTQPIWVRTSSLQSPESYETALVFTAISLAGKEGLDSDLLSFAQARSAEFRAMIRAGQMILPQVVAYGLGEEAP